MKLMIEWHYETQKKQQVTFKSDFLPAAHVYTLLEDMKKTGRIKNVILLDEYDSTWTLKELKKYLESLETEPHDVTLYFDGNFNREERFAGLGAVIYFKQNNQDYRLRVNKEADFLLSNNEAEYAALYMALGQLEELGVHHQEIEILGDSQVVINELNGEWGVSDGVLTKWADKIDQKLQQLHLKPHYTHIERNKNAEADQLASQALQGKAIHAKNALDKNKKM